MARYSAQHVNQAAEKVTILDTDTEYTVWNHPHATEIGTAGDLENARQMIEG